MTPSGVNRLLRTHARTFALTLRVLPERLQEPLGIAYLLARASDTVADTSTIPLTRRLALLEELERGLNNEDAGESLRWQPKLTTEECSTDEVELLASVPMLIGLMEHQSDGPEMFRLWRRILEGQMLDVRRLVPGAPPLNRAELERYCLLVAGSVGEAWTRLIGKHYPALLRPLPGEIERMTLLGISYGNGLQLLNILRDRAADRESGRVYFQENDLPEMMTLAAAWLDQGREYCLRLQSGRIRCASEIPFRLALRTLHRIRGKPGSPGVKIARWEVYEALLRTLPSLVLPGGTNPAS